MKAVREKASSILYYIAGAEAIEVRDDGFYIDGSKHSEAFKTAEFDVVEFDPADQLVFVDTHSYVDGVLAVADADKYRVALRRYARASLQMRDAFLAASDWTQMPDCNHPKKAEWAVYRQALRDIPQQSGFPRNIVWPAKPE